MSTHILNEPELEAGDFARLLYVTAGAHESAPIYWRRSRAGHALFPTDESPNPRPSLTRMHAFVPCSDVFSWGSADGEDVAAEEIDDFAAAIEEVRAAAPHLHTDRVLALAGWLFAARKRTLRPQGAVYASIPEALWDLFDAAGPGRDVVFGNPSPRPGVSAQRTEHPQDCVHLQRISPTPSWTPLQLAAFFGAIDIDSAGLVRWDVDHAGNVRIYVVNEWAERRDENGQIADCCIGVEVAPEHTEAFVAAMELEKRTCTTSSGFTYRSEGEPPQITARFVALTGLPWPRGAFH